MSLDAILRASHSDRAGDEALAIHQQLRQLVRLRERYDLTLGRLAIAIQLTEGWRRFGFATFAEYCEERLGMDVTRVEGLVARVRKLARRSRNADVRAKGGSLGHALVDRDATP
jgi:hypothetical protein